MVLDMDDTTMRLRVVLLRTKDDTRCFGCGNVLVGDQRGTSRFGKPLTVHLCTGCCKAEAFSGNRDPFRVASCVKEATRWGMP